MNNYSIKNKNYNLPGWYNETRQCIKANINQVSLKIIDEEKALNQIMEHIMTMIEIEYINKQY